jgi:type IV pilus assembly protein PilN
MIKINLLKDPFIRPKAKAGAAKNDAAAPSEVTGAKPDAKAGGRRQIPALGALACLVFFFFCWAYHFWLGGGAAAETARGAALSEAGETLKPYRQMEGRLKEQCEELRKKEEALARLKKQQQLPVYFLQELANSLPDNVWFVKIASKGQRVEIRGEALTEDAIYQFRDNLVGKDQWFRNVNFAGASRREKRLDFTITFELIPT